MSVRLHWVPLNRCAAGVDQQLLTTPWYGFRLIARVLCWDEIVLQWLTLSCMLPWLFCCCCCCCCCGVQWSIVVPALGLQQLAACQVEPSQLAAQLYSLLQATSSSQQQQQQPAAGSGYSGLPVDLPVRYVQGCMVAPNDPRFALINEFALKAIQVGLAASHDGSSGGKEDQQGAAAGAGQQGQGSRGRAAGAGQQGQGSRGRAAGAGQQGQGSSGRAAGAGRA
jgi:hypothetical protein